jgi:hypothetical protein
MLLVGPQLSDIVLVLILHVLSVPSFCLGKPDPSRLIHFSAITQRKYSRLDGFLLFGVLR